MDWQDSLKHQHKFECSRQMPLESTSLTKGTSRIIMMSMQVHRGWWTGTPSTNWQETLDNAYTHFKSRIKVVNAVFFQGLL